MFEEGVGEAERIGGLVSRRAGRDEGESTVTNSVIEDLDLGRNVCL